MNDDRVTGSALDAKILNTYRQLTPENKKHALRMLTISVHCPGFFEAYKVLPNTPGRNCPSKEDVERLMDEWESQYED